MKQRLRNGWLPALVLFSCAARLILCGSLPIIALNAPHDDLLMVQMAAHLLTGGWLGPYNENTLVKGIVFPLFLSAANALGIPYLMLLTLFNLLACAVFTYGVSKVTGNRFVLAAVFLVLSWNPVFSAAETFQRIYRCSLTPAQCLLLIGSCFLMYYYSGRSLRKMSFWSVIAGIVIWSMMNCREDGVWILPFTVTVMLLGIIGAAFRLRKRRISRKLAVYRTALFILPWFLLAGGNLCIAAVNRIHYGVFLVNELNQGEFPRMIKAIYTAAPDTDDSSGYISVQRREMERLYEASPTLALIRPELEKSMDEWGAFGRIPDDGEVENGWFFWSVRSAMADAGYFADATKCQQFCGKVADELEKAFREGRLPKRAVMPSALMAPWQKEYGSAILKELPQTVSYLAGFDDVVPQLRYSDVSQYWGRQYEILTGGRRLRGNGTDNQIVGWAAALNSDIVSGQLIDSSGAVISEIEFLESPDIYEYFKGNGQELPSAGRARFEIPFGSEEQLESSLCLRLCLSDGRVKKIPISDPLWYSDDDCAVSIDSVRLASQEELTVRLTQRKEKLLQFAGRIYQLLNPCLLIAGLLAYLYLTVRLLCIQRLLFPKRRTGVTASDDVKERALLTWLLLTGIMGSFFVLVAGVVYTHISSCYARNSYYLSAAYPLMTAFWLLAGAAFAESLIGRKDGSQK